jgi:hypothetical protein
MPPNKPQKPIKGSLVKRLNKSTLDVLGKFDSDPNLAILAMQTEIIRLKQAVESRPTLKEIYEEPEIMNVAIPERSLKHGEYDTPFNKARPLSPPKVMPGATSTFKEPSCKFDPEQIKKIVKEAVEDALKPFTGA